MKKVVIDENKNQIFYTYSADEYDRFQIDHVLYKKAFNKITDSEFNTILVTTDMYKMYEMCVHPDSFINNKYFYKKN